MAFCLLFGFTPYCVLCINLFFFFTNISLQRLMHRWGGKGGVFSPSLSRIYHHEIKDSFKYLVHITRFWTWNLQSATSSTRVDHFSWIQLNYSLLCDISGLFLSFPNHDNPWSLLPFHFGLFFFLVAPNEEICSTPSLFPSPDEGSVPPLPCTWWRDDITLS